MFPRSVFWLFGLLLVAALAGLALMPTPYVQDLPFVPRAVARLADSNDFLRNVLGGVVLQAAVLAVGWSVMPGRGPHSQRLWLFSFVGLMLFSALEVAQIFLPKRNFDGRDILAAALGIAGVTALVAAITRARRGS